MALRAGIVFCIIKLWLIVVGLLAIIHQFSWWFNSRKLLEAFCYLILFIVIFLVRPIRDYFTSIPKLHQYILITFFILLFIGQMANQPRLTFPFTSWNMYAKPENHRRLLFYQYQGLNDEEQRSLISPGDLLSPIGKSNVAVKLQFLVQAAFSNRNDFERKQNLEKLRELLVSIGEIYNTRHPEDPIHTLEIIECSIDLIDRSRSDVIRKSLWQVELRDRTPM
jgi:hypothetical protein